MNEEKKEIEPSHRAKVQLTWKNIVINAPPKAGKCGKKLPDAKPKEILRGVSGTVSPGEFLAILGASGAGKTTLLNFLSGRQISSKLSKTGDVFVNGVNKNNQSGFSTFTGYV